MTKKNRRKKNKEFVYLWPIFALATFLAMVFVLNHQNKIVLHDPKFISPTPSAAYNDFHLLIPRLDIDAPVISDVDGTNQNVYDKALENGVAQLSGSAKPGEGSNIFIFGHSSFYWWKPGEYKTIFAELPKIKLDDEVIIWYNQKEFKYKVISTKTVLSSQVNVTEKTSAEQLSLMTCVPVGTDQKRLIVTAIPE